MHFLPIELNWMILEYVDEPMKVVTKFVCKSWGNISSTNPKMIMKYAAENGYLTVLQWAKANGCPWDRWTCASAARNGHLAVLQWARANDCPWDELTCVFAAENGHLEALQWARANDCPQ